MRFLYLHGFASSPSSRKARFFASRLAEHGAAAEVLDLAPDFRHSTISGQLAILDRALDSGPAVLIGSSMGGYLAALCAARRPQVARVLLLAPAFDFHQLWERELGPERLEQWRRNGSLSVFHYGTGAPAALDYGLMLDAADYEPFPELAQPCLIAHGRQDPVAPFALSEEFALRRSNVTLLPFQSGHELTDVLDEIWESSRDFLLSGTLEVR